MYSRNYPAAKRCSTNFIGEIGETNLMYARASHMLADIAKVDDNYPGQSILPRPLSHFRHQMRHT